MKVMINDEEYEVIIERKRIKNMYLRVKEDLKIHVTCNRLVTNTFIKDFIKNNEADIIKMTERMKKRVEKKNHFYYLGKKYDIVFLNISKEPEFIDNKIYVKDINALNNFIRKKIKYIFRERLDYNYEKFNGEIPYPKLLIRKMTRKWGHCNKKDCVVTLNSDLIKYEVDDLDYVIVHELCHLIEFNHSKAFWNEVKKHKPDYTINKKHLKEE